jgi:hypothetical protein
MKAIHVPREAMPKVPSQSLGRFIEFPTIKNRCGDLTFVEGAQLVPFKIKRVYYIYGVPTGESRSGHAHRCLEQMLIAVAGSFTITLDDGTSRQTTRLDRPDVGLYVPKLMWRELEKFSPGAVCLALASARYDETDYIRDYTNFLDTVEAG